MDRHPEIVAALARRADELRALPSLEREDDFWLRRYETMVPPENESE